MHHFRDGIGCNCQAAYAARTWLVAGPDGVVGIATCFRLDGPEIESRLGLDFPRPSRPAMGFTQPPVQRVPSFFPGRGI